MANFDNADGSYNPNYFAHLQILGTPSDNAPVAAGSLKSDTGSRLATQFQRLIGKRQPTQFMKIRQSLENNADKLWSAHAMRGSEYERGGFLNYAAECLSTEALVATSVTMDVGFDVLPCLATQHYFGSKKIPTVRETMQQDGVTLPERASITVYIIAPKDKVDTVIDMMRQAANADTEQDTHRGFGFTSAVAKMVSGTQDQDGMKNTTGWFEIFENFFVFIDRTQFDKLAGALDLALPQAKPVPSTAPRP